MVLNVKRKCGNQANKTNFVVYLQSLKTQQEIDQQVELIRNGLETSADCLNFHFRIRVR